MTSNARTLSFFSFHATAPPEIYTLSLHDALPISELVDHAERGAHVAVLAQARIHELPQHGILDQVEPAQDRKSTRLNSSHVAISYAVFCLKKKKYFRRRITQARRDLDDALKMRLE